MHQVMRLLNHSEFVHVTYNVLIRPPGTIVPGRPYCFYFCLFCFALCMCIVYKVECRHGLDVVGVALLTAD